MLVSRRLGKLISGAYDSLIPFMKKFLPQKANVGVIAVAKHSRTETFRPTFGALWQSVALLFAHPECLLRRGLSKVSCDVSDG